MVSNFYIRLAGDISPGFFGHAHRRTRQSINFDQFEKKPQNIISNIHDTQKSVQSIAVATHPRPLYSAEPRIEFQFSSVGKSASFNLATATSSVWT